MNRIELDTDKFKDVKLPMQQRRHGGFNKSGPVSTGPTGVGKAVTEEEEAVEDSGII